MSFEDPTRFTATQKAIRNTVEAGYMFHGINMAPSLDVAGYPGRSSAVNPAFRVGGALLKILPFFFSLSCPNFVLRLSFHFVKGEGRCIFPKHQQILARR